MPDVKKTAQFDADMWEQFCAMRRSGASDEELSNVFGMRALGRHEVYTPQKLPDAAMKPLPSNIPQGGGTSNV
jgi:hypothetical protein